MDGKKTAARGREPLQEAAKDLLRRLAAKYETASFADGDPIGTLALAAEGADVEALAFVAAALSYGSRKQFIPKIAEIAAMAGGDVRSWVAGGGYGAEFREGDGRSFYRLFSRGRMAAFFGVYRQILLDHGSLGAFLRERGAATGLAAVETVAAAFGGKAVPIVPKDATSACKRLCMFLRWMVRDGSPVDKGLWSGWFDKRTLVVPLDVHVLRQAERLGLVPPGAGATMRTALSLTEKLGEAFPDDPCKGDFALYGLGVDEAAATR